MFTTGTRRRFCDMTLTLASVTRDQITGGHAASLILVDTLSKDVGTTLLVPYGKSAKPFSWAHPLGTLNIERCDECAATPSSAQMVITWPDVCPLRSKPVALAPSSSGIGRWQIVIGLVLGGLVVLAAIWARGRGEIAPSSEYLLRDFVEGEGEQISVDIDETEGGFGRMAIAVTVLIAMVSVGLCLVVWDLSASEGSPDTTIAVTCDSMSLASDASARACRLERPALVITLRNTGSDHISRETLLEPFVVIDSLLGRIVPKTSSLGVRTRRGACGRLTACPDCLPQSLPPGETITYVVPETLTQGLMFIPWLRARVLLHSARLDAPCLAWRGRVNFEQMTEKVTLDALSKTFLFSWGSLAKQGYAPIRNYIKETFNADWVTDAEVVMREDGFRLVSGDKWVQVGLDLDSGSVNLENNEGITRELAAVREGDDIDVYDVVGS